MPQLDVAREIKIDHDNVRDLFNRYKNTSDRDQKQKIAQRLISEIIIHGDAEEASVYKRFNNYGLGQEAKEDIKDHNKIKNILEEIRGGNPSDSNFDQQLNRAVTLFLEHSDEEENTQLKKLTSEIDPNDNDKLARDFVNARQRIEKSIGRQSDKEIDLKFSHNA